MAGSKAPVTSADGSDAAFRMKVDDIYKEMANMRRHLKISTKVQSIYIVVRSLWKFSPSFILGKHMISHYFSTVQRYFFFLSLSLSSCFSISISKLPRPAHTIYTPLLFIHYPPSGTPLPITDVLILLAGLGVFLLYRYAFGYGKAQHEKLGAIMTCTIINMLLMAEVWIEFECPTI